MRLNPAPTAPPRGAGKMRRMKHILDSEFRYRPSFDTDVRKTFEKARRQLQTREREQTEPQQQPEIKVKVLKLEQLKKASGT